MEENINELSSIEHYDDVIMGTIASQTTSLTIVYLSVYSDANERKHQSYASLAFVRGIHRGPVNSPHKWPVTRKMFPFDDVIMIWNSIVIFLVGCVPGVISASCCVNIHVRDRFHGFLPRNTNLINDKALSGFLIISLLKNLTIQWHGKICSDN